MSTQLNFIIAVVMASATSCATRKGTVVDEQVAFYQTGLVCPAAPKIGCGSAAKPILLELEQEPTIREAWLNRQGTTIALVPETGATKKDLARSAERVFKAHDVEAQELRGRADMEPAFRSRKGWLRGAEVDQLSIEEAGIIAERMLRRVEAKAPVAEKEKVALRTKFKELIEARFLRNSGPATPEEWQQKALEVARPVLNRQQLAALEEALALGFRPRAEEE